MNRLAVGTLLVAFLSVGGCGPADDSSAVPAYSSPYNGGTTCQDTACCSQYTSCGSCTPIVGCGWCANSDGTGSCAASGDFCTTDFIWAPNFCPGAVAPTAEAGTGGPPPADASTGGPPADGGLLHPSVDAARDAAPAVDASSSEEGDGEATDAEGGMATDAALDQSATSANPPPIIADGGGCTANDSSMCGASLPFGVTCVQSSANSAVPEPPPSLECTVADAPTPAGTLYYCCLFMPPGYSPPTPIP